MTVGFFVPQSLQYCSPVTDKYLLICDALKVGGEAPEERSAPHELHRLLWLIATHPRLSGYDRI